MENGEKPDLAAGIALTQIPENGMIQGQAHGEDVVLARRGNEFFAVGASCTHYGGPLVEGLLVGSELRCPLHHACFDLRTGEALRAPAFDPIPCWRVERGGDKIFVREKLTAKPKGQAESAAGRQTSPSPVVIVGGGAAGFAAAEMLRREGYDGALTMISADTDAPYDRPNLSKEFLAGKAPDEWMPLRPPDFYKTNRIDLVLDSRVVSVDVQGKRVQLANGASHAFGALLLATGAEPIQLPIPGAPASAVLYLRTFADGRALAEKAGAAKNVVIVGASFIGLEAAAALRERGVSVHVVAREQVPFERILGVETGQFLQRLHASHGVVFHLGETVAGFDGRRATLSGGAALEADLLLIGAGVNPSLSLAEKAGLKLDRGILVNEYLETSAPGIFAAGDIARWPDPHSGERVRIEHWVVAERQGQVAARNILGYGERFAAVPFFWTSQYDVFLKYAGHAEKWDAIGISGSLEAKNCAVTFKQSGRTVAVATMGRDRESLQAEADMEARLR